VYHLGPGLILITDFTASLEQITLNDPHPPHKNAIEAFSILLPTIKAEIVKSRHHWDKHEPRMWRRASGLEDKDLVSFEIEQDLVEVKPAFHTETMLKTRCVFRFEVLPLPMERLFLVKLNFQL